MPDGNLNEEDSRLIARLIGNEGVEIVHLPYTAAFDRIYSAFLAQCSVPLDKHEFWERILRIQSAGAPLNVSDVTSAERSISSSSTASQAQGPSETFPSSLFAGVEHQPSAEEVFAPAWQPEPKLDVRERRERVLADIANSRLGTIEQKVAYLLQHFPETRESDVTLCIRYWERFQADVLARWRPLELKILHELEKLTSIVRSRALIQNTLGLFRGLEDTKQFRMLYQRDWSEYLAARQGVIPEIRFYLDETGNEGEKAYTGLGGICVMNWKHFEMYAAALAQWRRDQNWPETIHFKETGSNRIDRAVQLLGQLQKRRSGLVFLGYALSGRGSTRDAIFSLFAQLVVDSLRYIKASGSLREIQSLRVIKEADPGFDSLYLAKLDKHLTELIALEFPDQLIVQPTETVTKGQHVLLECADLIAGGMQRRALFKGYKPKDTLAEAVVNVTGFEDPKSEGALFRWYPPFK
jgi:hypothetical protein